MENNNDIENAIEEVKDTPTMQDKEDEYESEADFYARMDRENQEDTGDMIEYLD